MKTVNNILSKIKKYELFKEAFTHSSYTNEHKLNYSYERLEFLGDAILHYLVSFFIYENFPELDEGGLTNLRSKAICKDTFAELSLKMGLNKHLLLGVGESESGGRKKYGILADIFESFIAAVFLTFKEKITLEILKETLFLKIKTNKLNNIVDYKT